jgi:hypothetical protein
MAVVNLKDAFRQEKGQLREAGDEVSEAGRGNYECDCAEAFAGFSDYQYDTVQLSRQELTEHQRERLPKNQSEGLILGCIVPMQKRTNIVVPNILSNAN